MAMHHAENNISTEDAREAMHVRQNGTQPSMPKDGTVVLEATGLRKEFPLHSVRLFGPAQAVHAVEHVSLTLRSGRALAVVGESGSGKTTVARMLIGMYLPTAGTISYKGEPVQLSNRNTLRTYRHHVQMVFQDPFASLNPIHSVHYILSRSLHIHGYVRKKKQEHEQITELLERVNLHPAQQFMEKMPHQLSGGQRQRVAIARALAVRPTVLLADEPVSMLDVSIRLDVLNLLRRLKNEEHLAVLFITHDIASARYFAEDTMVMYAGQMVEGGPSDEVIQRPKHPYTQMLISAAPDPRRIGNMLSEKTQHGEIPSLINPPMGCRFHTRCPHAMAICRERFPERTELGGGHWTHCFLYGKNSEQNAQTSPV